MDKKLIRPESQTAPLFDLQTYIRTLDRIYPRFLNQVDRDPDSYTFGSCDRHYWMTRLQDFDSGVLMQAPLVLAYLVRLGGSSTLKSSRYLEDTHVPYWRDLAVSISRRTSGKLESSGYLDEYFPGERSLVATVFAAYAALKCGVVLDNDEIINHPGLRTSAERLVTLDPTPAANQDTGAAAFLALYSKIHGWREDQTNSVVSKLLAGPNGRGEFNEHDGFDIGYASTSLNYLALMIEDESFDTRQHVNNLSGVIADFVTPSGRLGGDYASRSTTDFLPFGMIMAAKTNPSIAPDIAHLNVQECFERIDERCVMHFCLPALAAGAAHLAAEGPPAFAPSEAVDEWRVADHSSLGLFSIRNRDKAMFVGLKKGGTFHIEASGQVYIDCGYRITRKDDTFATCVVDEAAEPRLRRTEHTIEIDLQSRFLRYGSFIGTPLKTILLRCLGFFGPTLNAFFKSRFLKDVIALPGPVLKRRMEVDLKTNTLVVEDSVIGLDDQDTLSISPPISIRVSPRARFYQHGEIDTFIRRMDSPPQTTTRRTINLDDLPTPTT